MQMLMKMLESMLLLLIMLSLPSEIVRTIRIGIVDNVVVADNIIVIVSRGNCISIDDDDDVGGGRRRIVICIARGVDVILCVQHKYRADAAGRRRIGVGNVGGPHRIVFVIDELQIILEDRLSIGERRFCTHRDDGIEHNVMICV